MKRKFADGGGIGSYLKQKVNRSKTDHGVGLALPMASLKKFRGFSGGGTVKKTVTVPKKKLLGALMMAKQAGAQQAGAQPPAPPPAAPVGMKAGGFVPFWAKKKDGEGKGEKPVKKMACGGMVGRGDGCAQRGRTRGGQR